MNDPASGLEPTTPKSRYDLTFEEASKLTQQLLNERPPNGYDRHVCYRLSDDEYANIGRYVEREVFEARFGNDSKEMQMEYGPYEHSSRFLLTVDCENMNPTGVLRVIRNSSAGLKTFNDLEAIAPQFSLEDAKQFHKIDDLDECWDIGTVAVLPEHRSAQGAISVQLYRGVYVSAMEEKVQHVVSIIDGALLSKLTDYLGIPFVDLNDSQPLSYLGSESSQAVYGHVPDFYNEMKRRKWTIKGIVARKALAQLVEGSKDHTLQF
jgi:hypothetical protein